jgi:hypothetical protein
LSYHRSVGKPAGGQVFNNTNNLRQGAGENGPLKRKSIFQRAPHLTTGTQIISIINYRFRQLLTFTIDSAD